jgi:SpoVK/Ycf46/Vps4 family AAA+-type ATPase
LNPNALALTEQVCGAPDTGKTLPATIFRKHAYPPVCRVDLSRVIPEYIGETEKNPDGPLGDVHKQRRVLFFDEAEALFGKRAQVKNASDRYANREVTHLSQRDEESGGW